jgi:hypothetical protein
VFSARQEIQALVRAVKADSVVLDVVEYRQLAQLLDSDTIMAAAGEADLEHYLILVRKQSGFQKLGDLRGRRLITLRNPKMCVASAWLTNLLEAGGTPEASSFLVPQ